jgi:Coenzyme F420-dependent N5,N10-methylene tetrahydromethanopterin reductase and related flavin-dependent oxidoreductases
MLRAVRFCLMIEGQEGVTWGHWLALAETAERLGFEALFRSDHYFSARGADGRGSTDAWALLAALAARTERIRLGTLCRR